MVGQEDIWRRVFLGREQQVGGPEAESVPSLSQEQRGAGMAGVGARPKLGMKAE